MKRRAASVGFSSPGAAARMGLSLFTIAVLGLFAALSGCHGSPNGPTTTTTTIPQQKTITSIAVNGTAPSVGSTAQLTATASFSDGTSQDITTLAAWNTSNGAVATVNSAGVVTGVSAGQVNITATYQSSNGSSTGTISLTLAPPNCGYTLSVGSTINGYPTGGTFSVFVSTGGGCPWSATSTATWLHVSGSSTGSGTVTIVEDANTTGSARLGTVSIATQTITFNQPSQASSNAVTLTYTGNDFTPFGNYKTSDKVTGTVVLSAPLAKNLATSSCAQVSTHGSFTVFSNISSSVVSWSFSDGHQTINSSTSGDFFEDACFFTDASGTIMGWKWLVVPQNGTTKADIQTFDSEDFAQDATGSNGGQSNTTGHWTVSSSAAAPQGGIFPMIVEGVGLVLVLAVIRWSHSVSRISRFRHLTVPSVIGDSARSPLVAIGTTTAAVPQQRT